METGRLEPVTAKCGGGRVILLPCGERVTIKTSSVDTGGSSATLEVEVPSGYAMPVHTHRWEDETVFVLAGELAVTVGDELLTAGVGSTFYFPWGVRHAYRNVGPTTARILVTFTPGGFEEFYADLSALAERNGGTEAPMDQVRSLAKRYGVNIESARAALVRQEPRYCGGRAVKFNFGELDRREGAG